VVGAPHGARAACPAGTASEPCSAAQCDGVDRVACSGFVGSSVECRPASCQDNRAMPAGRCDGTGSCPAAEPIDCGAFVCDPAAGQCKTSCASDADCAAGRCENQKCITGSTCKDARTVVDPAGNEIPCVAYVCSAGACKESCTSTSDCLTGFVCEATSQHCVAASDTAADTGDEGGCGCRVPARSAPRVTAAWLLAALTLMRRRRRARALDEAARARC